MKKLLVLALVLSMATMANAAITLSISGAPASMTNGSTAVLAVTASGFSQGDGMTWALVATVGGLSGGVAAIPPAPDATLVFGNASSTDGPTGGVLINGYDGIIFGIDTFNTSGTYTAPGGDYITGLNFTFAGKTDLYIYKTSDFTNWEQMTASKVTITPEPMTMCILGLGGLFLRRRK